MNAAGAFCLWWKLGGVVLGSVFANVQDPKLIVKGGRGGAQTYENIPIHPPLFACAIAACCLQMRYG